MELSFDSILTVLGLVLGGGGIGGFMTWRYARRKEKASAKEAEANAVTAETTAVKEVQDVYQQLITDVKADRDEQKAYINELKDDRRHLREERSQLVQRLDQTDEKVRELQAQVARNGRMVESLRPFMCADLSCKLRQRVTISAEGEVKPKTKKKEERKDDAV